MRFSEQISRLDNRPGVYLMMGTQGQCIYIGKAKNLKNRLTQYFRNNRLPKRTQVMLSQVSRFEVVITVDEADSLIMENQLIKEKQPKYNILLKDDKSFPHLVFTQETFPRLTLMRKKSMSQQKDLDFYGPYPHNEHAKIVLDQVQRVFRLRNCSNHFFRNRSRPCIQHEIKRCTAPCVGLIDARQYQRDVSEAKALLEGRSTDLRDDITRKMYQYSKEKEYERAGACRDLLQSFASILGKGHAEAGLHGVVINEQVGSHVFILVMHILDDRISHLYLDSIEMHSKCLGTDWMLNYILNYYQTFDSMPAVLLLEADARQRHLLGQVLPVGKNLRVRDIRHKKYHEWYLLAKKNLKFFKEKETQGSLVWSDFWESLETYVKHPVDQIFSIDISHHQGSSTYASCVVCEPTGMKKNLYRAYRLRLDKPGDDYEAIALAVIKKTKTLDRSGRYIFLIDGGVGQLNAAVKTIDFSKSWMFTAISKGRSREWGKEKFYRYQDDDVELFRWPEVLVKYILHIRDEAHQFCIAKHRSAFRKAAMRSPMDDVLGLGREKKKALLGFFGGFEQVKCARIEELEKVPGIGPNLAKRIYDALHVEPDL